jgi:hypothetical protein
MAEHQPVNIHHCKSPIMWIWNTSGSAILLIQIPFETRRHVKSPWLLLIILVSLKIGNQKLHWFIMLSHFFNNEHATWLGGYTTFSDTPVPRDISSSTSPWFMIFLHDIQITYLLLCNLLLGEKYVDGDIQFWWLNHYLLLFAPNLFDIWIPRGYLFPTSRILRISIFP